ncbi:MAG: hypothetical protein ACU836_05095 [Gammaproteobacteria bacterium]
MVAFLRRFLVLTFALLQFAAPLVHAHVHNMGTASGLHLHELETLHVKSDTSFMATFDNAGSVQSAIVELGSAIKVAASKQHVSVAYITSTDQLAAKRYVVEIINFSPHQQTLLIELFPTQHTSRAPPL